MKNTNVLPPPAKSWWAPLWRGLVVDREGKHRRAMGQAVWLFLYLILHADRATGQVRRRPGTIGRDLAVSPRTVRAWMRRLRQGGYVCLERNPGAQVIHILKWRMPIRRQDVAR